MTFTCDLFLCSQAKVVAVLTDNDFFGESSLLPEAPAATFRPVPAAAPTPVPAARAVAPAAPKVEALSAAEAPPAARKKFFFDFGALFRGGGAPQPRKEPPRPRESAQLEPGEQYASFS